MDTTVVCTRTPATQWTLNALAIRPSRTSLSWTTPMTLETLPSKTYSSHFKSASTCSLSTASSMMPSSTSSNGAPTTIAPSTQCSRLFLRRYSKWLLSPTTSHKWSLLKSQRRKIMLPCKLTTNPLVMQSVSSSDTQQTLTQPLTNEEHSEICRSIWLFKNWVILSVSHF